MLGKFDGVLYGQKSAEPDLTRIGLNIVMRHGEVMNRLIDFISNNALASTLVGTAVVGTIGWAAKAHRDRRDSATVYNFLVGSKPATGYDYRSTEAIASNTNLSESRVASLCASHPKIRRNEKQLQSWTLAE